MHLPDHSKPWPCRDRARFARQSRRGGPAEATDLDKPLIDVTPRHPGRHRNVEHKRLRHSTPMKSKGSAATNSPDTSPDWMRLMSAPSSRVRVGAPAEKSRRLRSTQNTLGEVADS